MGTLRSLKGYQEQSKDARKGRCSHEHPAHLAYRLCYPFMIENKGGAFARPWDQRYVDEHEAV